MLKASRPLSVVRYGLRRGGGRLRRRRNRCARGVTCWRWLTFTLRYNLTLYGINDVCDHQSDRLDPRKNSVEGGLLPPRPTAPCRGLGPPLLAAGGARANGLLAFLLANNGRL